MIKVINVSAVPFHLARMQGNISKNMFQRTSEMSQSFNNSEVPILSSIQNINVLNENKPTKRISTTNERLMKKRNKILKHRTSSKISKEKLRLQRNILEQQLENLRVEELRLQLENEKLRLHHSQSEKQNESPKAQQSEKNGTAEHLVCGDTFKHASFVNIPLLKERVIPQVLTVLLMTFVSEVINSCQLKLSLIFPSCLKTFWTWSKCVNPAVSKILKNQMFLFALSHKT